MASRPAQGRDIPYGGRPFSIGELQVLPVFDGYSWEDPTKVYALHAGAPAQKGDRLEDWEPYRGLLDDTGRVEHSFGGFLVRLGDRLALVDAGLGPTPFGPFGPYNRVICGGELPGSLRAMGVAGEEVTDVVITHLHPDHFGWAAEGAGALFPRAVFHCHALDWSYFVTDPGDAVSPWYAGLRALEPRLRTIDHDGPLMPGMDVRLAAGHTPGSIILVLSSGSERAILLGDVVHCPVELLDDEWASLGDVDPALARRTKIALARELEGAPVPVVGAHFPGMRFGRLLTGRAGRNWVV